MSEINYTPLENHHYAQSEGNREGVDDGGGKVWGSENTVGRNDDGNTSVNSDGE